MAAITVATVQASSIAINTDWLSADLSGPDIKDVTKFTLWVRLATTSVINVQLVDPAANAVNCDLNAGTALTAGALYAFDIVIPPRYTFNLQHDTATQAINAWVVREDSSTEVA